MPGEALAHLLNKQTNKNKNNKKKITDLGVVVDRAQVVSFKNAFQHVSCLFEHETRACCLTFVKALKNSLNLLSVCV